MIQSRTRLITGTTQHSARKRNDYNTAKFWRFRGETQMFFVHNARTKQFRVLQIPKNFTKKATEKSDSPRKQIREELQGKVCLKIALSFDHSSNIPSDKKTVNAWWSVPDILFSISLMFKRAAIQDFPVCNINGQRSQLSMFWKNAKVLLLENLS